MADKTTETITVQMVAEFGDGSTYTISQNDPKVSGLSSKIKAFADFAVEKALFKSEKSDATITRIKSATRIKRSVTDLDLGT